MSEKEKPYGIGNRMNTCFNCKFYEERTHFCRKFPPVTVSFINEVDGKLENITSSKFPTISKCHLDFCSYWSDRNDNIDVNNLLVENKDI